MPRDSRDIHTIKYYSAIKNEGILSFAGKWMELENIIISEIAQTQRTCMVYNKWILDQKNVATTQDTVHRTHKGQQAEVPK